MFKYDRISEVDQIYLFEYYSYLHHNFAVQYSCRLEAVFTLWIKYTQFHDICTGTAGSIKYFWKLKKPTSNVKSSPELKISELNLYEINFAFVGVKDNNFLVQRS